MASILCQNKQYEALNSDINDTLVLKEYKCRMTTISIHFQTSAAENTHKALESMTKTAQ